MTEENVIARGLWHRDASFSVEDNQEETSWLQQAQCAAVAGAWEWDLEAEALRGSSGFCTLHGLDPEATGAPSLKAWLQCLHPDDRRLVAEMLRRCKEGSGSIDTEYRLLRGAEIRWVHVKGRVLCNCEGRPVRLAGLAMDVTRRRQQSLELLLQSDSERRRISHALRDELGQQLTGILLKSQVLQEKLCEENSEHAGYLERIVELLGEAHTYTREMARTLTPVIVRREELKQALSQLAANTKSLFNVACWFESDEAFAARSDEVATHLHRVAGAAVERAVRQARARRINIELFVEKDWGVLRISDDGKGEDGLSAVRRCIDAMGATLAVQPAVLGGLAVTCSFPL